MVKINKVLISRRLFLGIPVILLLILTGGASADVHQGWTSGGQGGNLDFGTGLLKMTFSHGEPFDPWIENDAAIKTEKVHYLAMRIRLTDAPSPVPFAFYIRPSEDGGSWNPKCIEFSVVPTGDWQIIRTNISSNLWQGEQQIRIDPAEREHTPQNADKYLKTVMEIEWIALTDNSDFDDSSIKETDIVWKFTSKK